MLTQECFSELRTSWLPNITDAGLDRLIGLLEQDSPLLIHGSFTRTLPMGCLATHVGWNHPATAHLTLDAGICWLNGVAGLNPATSHVVLAWDQAFESNWEVRADLMAALKEDRSARRQARTDRPQRISKQPAAV